MKVLTLNFDLDLWKGNGEIWHKYPNFVKVDFRDIAMSHSATHTNRQVNERTNQQTRKITIMTWDRQCMKCKLERVNVTKLSVMLVSLRCRVLMSTCTSKLMISITGALGVETKIYKFLHRIHIIFSVLNCFTLVSYSAFIMWTGWTLVMACHGDSTINIVLIIIFIIIIILTITPKVSQSVKHNNSDG